jgi:hypothetical protein
MDSKIIRIVHGHYADPNSTRDLLHVTDEELDHIRMSCEAGRMEAEIYLAMGDDELKTTLERNIKVFCAAGMSVPCPVPEPDHFRKDGPVREYLQTRYRAVGSFLSKLSKARGGAIRGITPLEYEHLVTSLQAAYREAEVCCTLSHERIMEAFAKLKEITERLGVGFENPYSGRCGDYFEFFQERAEELWDVMGRVNQPYSIA